MVRVIGLDIIANTPRADGTTATAKERLDGVVDNAVLFEQLGFDGYAVGERHHAPFVSSSPPVILSAIAARTTTLKLFTGVTLLSVLDPVRVAEDYATLDLLSGGRLELIVGKGNGPEQTELFGIERDDAGEVQRENYRLLRAIWSGEPVDWEPPADAPRIRSTPLRAARVHPSPLQEHVRIWHGSSTSAQTVELAAEYGDPIWVANFQKSVDGYRPLVEHYRAAWAAAGRDPADALVGAGFTLFVTKRSQDAVEAFRPVYEKFFASRVDTYNDFDSSVLFHSFEDYLARSAALVGSPQQVIDKLAAYQEAYGYSAISIPGHPDHWTREAWIDSLELFRAEVLPVVDSTVAGPRSW
ncbi:LLM class flavin-dependent oxidoreductase [Microbacterium sp.]|uniref:LLM class flavin-dependent oxidoreductase n=1 Tax=Microbacterium sp. TaxID=51671 RepID=UPI0039E2AA8F